MKKKEKRKENKCRCYQCLCTGGGSLLNVKLRDLKTKTKKKTCILLFCFSRVHWGRHLILKMFYLKSVKWNDTTKQTNKQTKKKRNEVVWVLLLVHITLHGMIGGLLKHFPKAVCGIIFFICLKKKKKKKTLLNVKKKKEEAVFFFLFFFPSPSRCICHSHTHTHTHSHTHTTSTKSNLSWESGTFFFISFISFFFFFFFTFFFDSCRATARRAALFCLFCCLWCWSEMQSAWNRHLSRSQSAAHTHTHTHTQMQSPRRLSLSLSLILRPRGQQVVTSYNADGLTAGCRWPEKHTVRCRQVWMLMEPAGRDSNRRRATEKETLMRGGKCFFHRSFYLHVRRRHQMQFN